MRPDPVGSHLVSEQVGRTAGPNHHVVANLDSAGEH